MAVRTLTGKPPRLYLSLKSALLASMASVTETPAAGTRRVAIVTGASRGIGAELARRLARDSFDVVVNFASKAADADAVVKQIRDAGGRAIAVQADVTQEADWERMMDTAETADFSGAAAAGAGEAAPARRHVHALVLNAGVMQEGLVPIASLPLETAARILNVNVMGVHMGLQQAARRLADGGRVVVISSTIVATCPAGYSMYAASKAAVEALAKVASKELAPRRVAVNCVAPGGVMTELFTAGKSEDLIARIAAATPMARIGQPGDISGPVAFLCGDEAGWVTGQVLRCNGGVA